VKARYYTFVHSGNPEDLEAELNTLAQAGWVFETCRRIREKPFELLVIMKRKDN
jgi:hypothetical protein